MTTEFGVMEEPANLTTVSASGPSPYHMAFDQEEEESNVEMTEDLDHHQHIENLHLHNSQSTPNTTAMLQVLSEIALVQALQHAADATGEEGDIDTDDFDAEADADADAESAIIEEFIDDVEEVAATPTITITHTGA